MRRWGTEAQLFAGGRGERKVEDEGEIGRLRLVSDARAVAGRKLGRPTGAYQYIANWPYSAYQQKRF